MIENPRVRLALAEHGRRIALGLAVAGAVLLVLAIWTAFTPPTDTVTQQTDGETISTDVEHSALVRSGDAPWASGTVLEDHPAYLLNASPVLDLTVGTDAPPGSTVVHSVRLRVEVLRSGDGGGAVVWEDVRSLAAEEHTVEDGTATTAASIDVAQLRQRRAELQREFAGVGTVRTAVVTDARYETDRYEGNLTASAPLSVTGRAFWIDGDASDTASPSEAVTVTRQAPIDWTSVLAFVVLGIGAVGGAAAAATYRGEADIEWLRQELHRQRYDDWISDGDVPMGVGSEYVSLDSLQDVVDVAIDTNQRVVYDDRRDVFAVISGEVVYYYSKDGDWNRVAWPRSERDDDGPSFLDAFGMGDDGEAPEVEAGAAPAGAGSAPGVGEPSPDVGETSPAGDADVGDGPDSDVDSGDDGAGSDADSPPGASRPGDAADRDPPADDSLSPAERPPEDRPFGGDDEDE